MRANKIMMAKWCTHLFRVALFYTSPVVLPQSPPVEHVPPDILSARPTYLFCSAQTNRCIPPNERLPYVCFLLPINFHPHQNRTQKIIIILFIQKKKEEENHKYNMMFDDAWKCSEYPYNFASSYSNWINYAIKVQKRCLNSLILLKLNDGQKAHIYYRYILIRTTVVLTELKGTQFPHMEYFNWNNYWFHSWSE